MIWLQTLMCALVKEMYPPFSILGCDYALFRVKKRGRAFLPVRKWKMEKRDFQVKIFKYYPTT